MKVKKDSWEQQLGGRIGDEFRKALEDSSHLNLIQFVKEHPKEAQDLLQSSRTYLGKPHPKLHKALENSELITQAKSSKRTLSPTTIGLITILVLISFTGGFAIYNLVKQNHTTKSQNAIVEAPKDVAGVSTPELATLENKDAGYTVKYPDTFDAMYTQDGVEFTPKQGGGKVVLKINKGIIDVNVDSNGVNQSEITNLNSAAQTIKSTLQFIQPSPSDTTNNEGRFANIHFDPKKY